MAINDAKVKFYSANLNQSGIINSSVEPGSIVYSTVDKALYIVEGQPSPDAFGRTAHLISNIIEFESEPSLSNMSNHSPEKVLYKYNNHLHYYNNSTLYQLVNAGELTDVDHRVTALEETSLTSDELDLILNNKNYITNDVLEKNYVSNTELSNYVTTDTLNNTVKDFITVEDLSNYVTTEDISDFVSSDNLSIYAKTADIENTYAKTADIENTYAKTTVLDNYLTKSEADNQYLTQNTADNIYATIENMEVVSRTVGNHTESITEINTEIDGIQSSVELISDNTDAINNLKTFTGYTGISGENFKSLNARLDTLEDNYVTLDGSKLNASDGKSNNLTESTKLTVGTKDGERLELSKSNITKYAGSTDTTGTSVLFKGDVSVSESENSYTISDGTGKTITINIPSDLVVSSGVVETDPDGLPSGTYLILTLNDDNKDKIYIDVKDLANDYTVASSDSSNPIELTLDSNHQFNAKLKSNSVTSEYLADDIELTSLTVSTIKNLSGTNVQSIKINGGTIDADGVITKAANLTEGKTISISGDIEGQIENVGTSSSSGKLFLSTKVNTSASVSTGLVEIKPSIDDASKDDLKVNIPNFVADNRGLVLSAGTTSVSIGAVNTVKKSEDTTTATSKPIAFMAGGSNDTNDTILYNSGVTVTPSSKTITAEHFVGVASEATKLTDGIFISLTNAVEGSGTWKDGALSIEVKGPGKVDSKVVGTDTSIGSVSSKSTETATITVPRVTMNKEGMVSNIIPVDATYTLNQVRQNITTNSDTTEIPILLAGATSATTTAETNFSTKVTVQPSSGNISTVGTITATNGFSGALDGNATTASAFQNEQTVTISGGATGTYSSKAGWSVPITLNSKLIVGNSNSAVTNATSETANDKTYLNLYAPNASNINTVLSSLRLQGSGATTVSATNGTITINSPDYTNAISNAQATAISTAATDATSKANAAAKTVYNTIMSNSEADSIDSHYLLARTVDGMDANGGIDGNVQTVSHEDIYFTDSGKLYANKVYGAVWNDYAEYRKTHYKVRPGQCVYEKGNGELGISYERMMPGANIVSDTFGFAIGETDECKTPLAVSGRVLAYPFEERDIYHPGDAVCSGPNGTVSKMTRAEIRDYPERIVGTVSEIPTYETWGTGNVKVNGRIWIKVR